MKMLSLSRSAYAIKGGLGLLKRTSVQQNLELGKGLLLIQNILCLKMVQLYRILALSLSLVYTALAACNYGTTEFPREPNVPIGTFGYTGLDGPLNWYSLDKSANILCAEGHFQSPINLNSSIRVAPGNRGLTFNITSYPEGAELENLGTTLEVPANGTFTIADNTYNLAQFHFHTPSEHRIDLEHYPMELHFVFQAAGQYPISAFLA